MRRLLITTILFGGFAACSNGSGGPAPLRLTSQWPAPSSVVEPDATVRLVFDRDPDQATLTATALSVADLAGPIAGSHSYDAASRTWTWTAADELPRAARVTVLVADTLRTLEGGPVAGPRSWSFMVRDAAPAAPVLVRGSAVITGEVLVGMHGRGQALIAAGASLWELDANGVSPEESMPVVQVSNLQVDSNGGATVAGGLLGHPGVNMSGFYRRAAANLWTYGGVLNSAPGQLVGYRLLGNDAGDIVLHALFGDPPASHTRHQLRRATLAAPTTWQWLPEVLLQAGDDMIACIDARGHIATLRDENGAVIAERHAPDGTMSTHTVAQGQLQRVESLSTDADGRLRAVWHAPGSAMQAFAEPDLGFAAATVVPVGIPSASHWLSAPTGAVLGWNSDIAFRSEAGSSQWVAAQLPAEPIAAAMSPRGEAVFVYFTLPEQLMLVRWRVGEVLGEPQQLASIPSAFNAQRRAAVAIDAAGRVVVAFVPSVPGDLVAIRFQ